MADFKIDLFLVSPHWYKAAEWRHPQTKWVVIFRVFTFQCDLRQRAISWRTIILRFPRWPWLRMERDN